MIVLRPCLANIKLKDSESCLHIKNLSRPEAIKAVWTSYEETCSSLQGIFLHEKFDK